MENNKLIASSSPHIRSEESTNKIMLDVIIGLLPAVIASIYFFGSRAGILILVSVLTAVITEAACQRFMKKPITINDFSAVVTGILLAFNIPPTAPIWLPIVGSFFAIAIGKQVFGGLGYNFMNPALLGRAFLMACWLPLMTNFVSPNGIDAITMATPLSIMKGVAEAKVELPPLADMIIGRISGCLGETSSALIIMGGLYLIIRKVISWRIPVSYIGTVAIISLLLEGNVDKMLYHLFGGGLMLGAFFMATDYASCPITQKGKIIYGVGAGLLTVLIRKFGGYPEGVSYSILLMNVVSPIIDKYIVPNVFGVTRKRKKV